MPNKLKKTHLYKIEKISVMKNYNPNILSDILYFKLRVSFYKNINSKIK